MPINQLKLGLPSVNLTGTPLALHAELDTRASWESEADMKENAVIDRPLALAQQQQQQQPLMCRGERVYWPPSVMTQARQSLWSPTAKQSPGASSALIGIATPPKAAGGDGVSRVQICCMVINHALIAISSAKTALKGPLL